MSKPSPLLRAVPQGTRVSHRAIHQSVAMPAVDIGYKTRSNYQVSAAVFLLSNCARKQERGALVDRGANGGLLGNDASVFHKHKRVVDVRGIDNHELLSLPLVDASAKIKTNHREAIGIFCQYAYLGLGRTIHSTGQIEHS